MDLERKPTTVLLTVGACMLACGTVAAGEDPVIWEQPAYGYNGTISNTDCAEPFGSLADGFVGDGRDVVALAWWGGVWSNAELTGFQIDFWTRSGDCPDLLLDSRMIEEFDVVPDPSPNPVNRYSVALDPQFFASEDTPYALSVTAITCDPDDPFPLHFFWQNAEGDGTRFCIFTYDEKPWRPSTSQHELAFVLYAEKTSPVGDRSWSEIKATYR